MKKSITGPGAGEQGDVVIQPTCDGTDLPPFTIAAGATGQLSKTYLVAPGSVCTITETVDGHTSTVTVTVDGSGQQVTVPGGSSVQAVLTDTYDLVPGSLTVTKTIAGPAAGQQGIVTISVTCNENGVDTPLPDFTIAAGAAAGSTSRTYTGIPAGSVCTATETATGDTSTLTTTVTGDNGTPISIPAGGTGTAVITDTYALTPGALIVKKTITGPGAGLQGTITIQPTCGGTDLPVFSIPAGTAAGQLSKTYDNIPAGTTCTITETGNGANSAVSVVVTGDDQVTVPPGGIVTRRADRHLQPEPRLARGEQDHHRRRCRATGTDHHRGDLRQQRPDHDVATTFCHSRRGDRSRVADLHRHSRRLGVHGGRDPRRQHGHAGSAEAGQRV